MSNLASSSNFSLARYAEAAKAAFIESGWPSRKSESWHYSDLNRFIPLAEAKQKVISASEVALEKKEVQLNTRFQSAIEILKDEFGTAIDYTLAQAGHCELVHLSQSSNTPITFTSEASKRHSVRMFEISASAEVLLYTNEATSNSAECSAIEIFYVAKGAKLTWLDRRKRNKSALGYVSAIVIQEEDSEVKTCIQLLGGDFNRYSLLLQQNGANCKTFISDFRAGSANDHIDFRSVLHHSYERGFSRQTSHALLSDKSRGIFNGRVIIARNSQQVDLGQICRSLLLSEAAEADAKPELEIYADNVKATHGATVGALDPDSLFYLMSRGMSQDRAKSLLCRSFAMESLAPIISTALFVLGASALSEFLENMTSSEVL